MLGVNVNLTFVSHPNFKTGFNPNGFDNNNWKRQVFMVSGLQRPLNVKSHKSGLDNLPKNSWFSSEQQVIPHQTDLHVRTIVMRVVFKHVFVLAL